MTTAFTAIPKKITTSTMRILGGAMVKTYPTAAVPSIDPDQVRRIFVESKDA